MLNRTASETEPPAQISALWDMLWQHDLSTQVNGTTGMAGIGFTGNEYWVSIWFNDSIFFFDQNGSFLRLDSIPDPNGGNIRGIRAFSWDGSQMWASNNTNTLYRINPVSKTVSNTVSSPIPARFAAWDPLADGGNGGFWVGGFGTPIKEIDMSGNELANISFSTHGLEGAYGAAVDHQSGGGPFLWVFHQPGATISQLTLNPVNLGLPTGINRDVAADFGSVISLSGGLYISENHPNHSGRVLGGLLQNSPDLHFGYDLEFQVYAYDAKLEVIQPLPSLTMVPKAHVPDLALQAKVSNAGTQPIQGIQYQWTVKKDGQLLTEGVASSGSLAAGTSTSTSLGSYRPPQNGTYQLSASSTLSGQSDENPVNNSITNDLVVNDSTFARDNGLINGSISIGEGPNKGSIIGHSFDLKEVDFMTSVSFYLVEPEAGDQVFATVYINDSLGIPENALGISEVHTVTAEEAQGGAWINLIFSGGPVPMPSGPFFVGINETGGPLTLATTPHLSEPSRSLFRSSAIANGEWQRLSDQNFEGSLLIRPHFGPCSPTYMSATTSIVDDENGGTGSATVFPLGASEVYTYLWDDPNQQTTQTAENLLGNQSYTVVVTDSGGCKLEIQTEE
ncbi:MAG: hypothetical protein AAF206_31450, partial [Bacteroidota bacterium]